ncbi:MAG: hypothetical protein HDS27_06570 [Bacteroides sp.]|nr:hypothetical protein [Bacteroides sp.]
MNGHEVICMMELFGKIRDVIVWIRDFFVLMWNDDDFWWCLAGLVIVIIGLCKVIIIPLWRLLSSVGDGLGRSGSRKSVVKRKKNKDMKVTIKGVYQMNGPKPFVREISCSQSEAGYYSQLMTNKSRQAEWISANFPGAQIGRGFSMSVNIK